MIQCSTILDITVMTLGDLLQCDNHEGNLNIRMLFFKLYHSSFIFKGEKIRRKGWLPAFSLYPTTFSKNLFLRVFYNIFKRPLKVSYNISKDPFLRVSYNIFKRPLPQGILQYFQKTSSSGYPTIFLKDLFLRVSYNIFKRPLPQGILQYF